MTGRDASLDLPRRREAGATLLEECMLGPERMLSEVKMRHAVHSRGESTGARPAKLVQPRCLPPVRNCLRCSPRSLRCRTVCLFLSSFLCRYMSCYRTVVSTTKDQTNTGLARATNPAECVERLPGKPCTDADTGHRSLSAHCRVGVSSG